MVNKENAAEEVDTLRQMVLEKYEQTLKANEEEFHPFDLHRLKTDDKWLANFLLGNDHNMKNSYKQLWDTLMWRKKFGVNEITEKSVREDYLKTSNIYIHGRDVNGKLILMVNCKNHTRGSKNIEDLKVNLVYWVERGLRESNNEKLTMVMDLYDTGMKHVDMEYTQVIINTLKAYYPEILNWILIYDMPWFMNAAFQIIKKLLPKSAVEVLKFINGKSARTYFDEENMPVTWGGKDNYVYQFEPEKRHEEINAHELDWNLESSQKKVHFANNLSESPSPLSELSTSSFETRHDMLQLSPAETIVFQKNSSNELTGNVHILNVSKKAVTYKVKTTAPDKFRVRPSSGTLSPMTSANINVVIQKGQLVLPVSKDKFLVMCMALPDGEPLSADEIANMWKEVTANSPEVEQHRLKCTMPANITTAIINNTDISGMMSDNYIEPIMGLTTSSISHNGTKQSMPGNQQHLNATINQLSETVIQLNQQVRSQATLQWITIFLFVMLSVAIVYILKIEIQNSNSQYCIDK